MMTGQERQDVGEGTGAVASLKSRTRRALETAGTVAAVAVVLVALNFVDVAPLVRGLTLGQIIVGLVALSVAVEATRWVRRGARREARRALGKAIGEYGGGVYGTAALATFLWLNVTDVLDDIAAAGSLAAYVADMSVAWLIGEAVEAVIFGIQSMIWPWHWFSSYGPIVALAIGGAVLAVDLVRKPLARRLAARSG